MDTLSNWYLEQYFSTVFSLFFVFFINKYFVIKKILPLHQSVLRFGRLGHPQPYTYIV